ncbi:hypothetical protein [Rheinheimera sp. MM224]|uniref:hypothetical protein n=1 Tax=Rheinheimera sp. MM224 TaxID=3019969 RepID=UPI0021F8CC9D|nr:hypothetical protein [Rheinheimera sp. MM224]CAI3800776.1 hypothetical protein JAMGFMIE_02675 [Rheinheimera sp. MM224]
MEELLSLIARGLLWLTVDILFFKICYRVGFVFFRLITAGRYPRFEPEIDEVVTGNNWVAFVGSLILVLALLLICFW